MDDDRNLRNLIVRLALEAQALLDHLQHGREGEAQELSLEMSELAAAIAEMLTPTSADNAA